MNIEDLVDDDGMGNITFEGEIIIHKNLIKVPIDVAVRNVISEIECDLDNFGERANIESIVGIHALSAEEDKRKSRDKDKSAHFEWEDEDESEGEE